MPGRRSFLLFPLLGAAALSCVDLPVIEENRCGNGFIEVGEDCDFFTQPKSVGTSAATCNLPGTTDQCRWRCDYDAQCQTYPVVTTADPAGAGKAEAPGGKVKDGSGWRCGTDHVCRLPQGANQGKGTFFDPVSSLVGGNADQLFTGDFDGDGRKDVLSMSQAGFDVHYLGRDGAESKAIPVAAPPVAPGIGKLTSSPADDFTVDVARGTGVMRGGIGQILDPVTYFSLDIAKRYGGTPPDDMRLFLYDRGAGPKPIVVANLDDFVQVIDAAANPDDAIIGVTTGFGRKVLLGSIPVSFLKPPTPSARQRFALAYEGQALVFVADILPNPPPMTSPLAVDPIALPDGFTVHGAAFFVDADSDGLTDVVVGAAQCKLGALPTCDAAELVVAYGDGDGGFYGLKKTAMGWDPAAKGKAAPLLQMYPIDKSMLPPPPKMPIPESEMEQYLPLAVGRLSAGGALDVYVSAFGIYVDNSADALQCTSALNGYCRTDRPSVGGLWSEARIVDLNADGRADVVGISPGNQGIDFFNGAGNGVFNSYSLPTEGEPRNLVVGDFDGDLVADLAFDSVTTAIDKVNKQMKLLDVHKVFVAFGSPSGAPAAPADMGEVPSLGRLAAGNLPSLGQDAATDLVLISGVPAQFQVDPKGVETKLMPGSNWQIGLALGNGYRQLQAPLVFFDDKTIDLHGTPLAAAIGRFDGDDSTPSTASAHADIAQVITRRAGSGKIDDAASDTPLCDYAAELWLLPATAEAAIVPPADSPKFARISLTPGGAFEPLLPIRRLVEAVPIDVAGGAEELLIAYPSFHTCRKDLAKIDGFGELYLARFSESGSPTVTPIVKSFGPNQFLVHLRVGDIDGDGNQDIVALKTTQDLDTIEPLATTVVMLRGNGDGTFADAVEIPVDGFPIDFALVNADGNSNPEIVVAADLEEAGQGAALFVIGWDEAASDPAHQFKTLLSGTASTGAITGAVLESPKAIVGGDFDGDGVDDVAVAVAGGVRLFKGVAR